MARVSKKCKVHSENNILWQYKINQEGLNDSYGKPLSHAYPDRFAHEPKKLCAEQVQDLKKHKWLRPAVTQIYNDTDSTLSVKFNIEIDPMLEPWKDRITIDRETGDLNPGIYSKFRDVGGTFDHTLYVNSAEVTLQESKKTYSATLVNQPLQWWSETGNKTSIPCWLKGISHLRVTENSVDEDNRFSIEWCPTSQVN